MAELGLGEELEDRRRHHVRGGVADDAQRRLVVLLEQLKGDVFGQRSGEVDETLAGLRAPYMLASEAASSVSAARRRQR